MILNSPVKYIIPWRVVWSKSVSTPIRPVFDASQRGPNGCSLNDILAKGSNNMNNLVVILLPWLTHVWAYHTDIRTMYNRIKLLKWFSCYQLYLWQKDLDPSQEPLLKVIMTLIYGVRSSGDQAKRAIRLTAEKNMKQFPKHMTPLTTIPTWTTWFRANTVKNWGCKPLNNYSNAWHLQVSSLKA